MRFAEVFLRLGCALVAWMMLYAYVLWLAALHAIGCGPDGDELHRLLLGMAPLAVVSAFALRVTRPYFEIHAMLRWPGVPLIVLGLIALRSVWDVIMQVYLAGAAICVTGNPATWELIWVPVHVAALSVIAILVVRKMKHLN